MISIIKSNDKQLKKEITNRLHIFNKENNEWLKTHSNTKYINFFAYDNKKLIGGAIGYVIYNWFYLDMLFVDSLFQRQGIGTMLMHHIEEFAKQNNLVGIRVETWDFQAKGFYEKNGYTLFGEINDCPPGTTEYFLKKRVLF